MKHFLFCSIALILFRASPAQTVSQKLQKAFSDFEASGQMKYGISSLYVIDAQTGQVVFDRNSRIGLAPASTQKTITSVTAFELLGKDYRYRTDWLYYGNISNDTLKGLVVLRGSGDPTLGSSRYEATRPEVLLKKWAGDFRERGIRHFRANVSYDARGFSAKQIPDGWIWTDIGNYYGAAPGALVWKENQRDLVLRSGNEVNGAVEVVNDDRWTNELRSAPRGTGDNAYAYLFDGTHFVLAGTIPVGEKQFRIAVSEQNPLPALGRELDSAVSAAGITGFEFDWQRGEELRFDRYEVKPVVLSSHHSPPMDQIVYWFNRKSINLYGEALLKTLAREKYGFASTDSGLSVLKEFWKDKGMDVDELNLHDGSGLSPQNRVTTHAQVEILRFARQRNWFPEFYESLPEYNQMKMKSGTISGVKGFCGYHKSKSGKEYIFSFLVNNYSGRSSGIVAAMYRVLDHLK